ncbi:biopolymer transporter ExbD [Massilia sp. P8910]|uniref:ExbD/TolR family protein n=1 Tax=Massilia antarctica TaxID=2765360 RepID=UPI0006BB946B|nr:MULTISPECIES: biopolymer transporter ExbD [Massilia]MCE3607203.1 biopolymer transporter ExbD [Massilia antarctica]MCY0915322.1 biopolymer transporter ExbD [Massilia sp. H27-R4]CUI05782.1 Biopolymer transport protein ExbD/TolR [Janthinobacterium sp. CG23_2]CUU29568.1 Biopolymer transport protein ExbD/TolR [Janthinobacterium sp. CG23_2]
MAFGSFNPSRQQSMMSDINVTPMVDVMLVLLVIFIITAPMFTHAVKLDLPRAQAAAVRQQPATVTIAIDAAGALHWSGEQVDPAGLDARLTQAARQAPQPELQLRADKNTRYEVVAQVMAAAQSHGLSKLGFVTDPKKEK